MSAGYALAYFFVYALYYVPGLTVLDEPYVAWALSLVLAAVATRHGASNRAMRWVTPVFTFLATGHVTFHVLASTASVVLFGLTIKVAALGCFFGMLWCASLSAVYKRLESRYNWPGTSVTEAADWLFSRVAHEVYFIAAALFAMALPLFLVERAQAPLWWSIEAPILLLLGWHGANYFKHGVVALIWIAAAGTMGFQSLQHSVTLPVLIAVPVAGVAIGAAYRFLRGGSLSRSLRGDGYSLYTYAAFVVALLVPLIQLRGNLTEAVPYLLVESLLICAAAIALRDWVAHCIGVCASLVSVALYGWQYTDWTWPAVTLVIAGCYGLSIAYGAIRKTGGLPLAEFLRQRYPSTVETVSMGTARVLEQVWSWAGTATLLAATYLLSAHSETVLWWSAAALLLMALSALTRSWWYRDQAYVAFALALGRLALIEVALAPLTLYAGFKFAFFGVCCIAASYLCHRQKARLEQESEK